MTVEVKGEEAATQSRSPVEAHAPIAVNSLENQGHLAGSSKRKREATIPTNLTIVAVCLLLDWSVWPAGSGDFV